MDADAQLAPLQQFREDVYGALERRSNAQFHLLDAITTAGMVPSFAHLSLQGSFLHRWGSLYAALTQGTHDLQRLRAAVGRTLRPDVPPVFAIDTSTWVKNDAETSPGRGFYYHASRHSAGKPVVAGWSFSWIAQLGTTQSSWTAPLDVRRVSVEGTAHQTADDQIQQVMTLLHGTTTPLFVFDGGYDPTRLAKLHHAEKIAVLVRVRRNRRFYFDVDDRPGPQGGRPRVHGARFSCQDETSWPAAHQEHLETTPAYGAVRVRAWSGLHVKSGQDARPGDNSAKTIYSGTVLLLEVSKLPRETRTPQAFWLWWRGPGLPDLALLWRAYTRRFDLEHTFRFLKGTLNWDKPRVRTPEQAEQWSWLVLLAFTQLRLARAVLEDARLPWQAPQAQGRLTPSRARQGFAQLLPRLGTPASPPKPCGHSPGRPSGRRSPPATRYPAVKRTA